jgi:nucleoside-diphosphate-sugar epimerase
MRAVVTGCAGFIGSTLVDELLTGGWPVIGVDRFDDYYDSAVKRANLTAAMVHPSFELRELDVGATDWSWVQTDDVVFHLAAQPGVRASWADGFDRYVDANIRATQRLLEGVRAAGPRLVLASSSSVYGNATEVPTAESAPTAPFSPYGVTKLAAEHLCRAYAANFGLPLVVLRYFTVFGPRQRPDMAIHRLVEAALSGGEFALFGDGGQVRDFTFVADVVRATMLAGTAVDAPGSTLNVAGGSSVSMAELVDMVNEAVGAPVRIVRRPVADGDVRATGGSTAAATAVLGWTPQVHLADGIARQVAWHRARRS